jgi:hypothetical protein
MNNIAHLMMFLQKGERIIQDAINTHRKGYRAWYCYFSRKFYSSKAREPFLALLSLDLFSFFRAIPHSIKDRPLALSAKRLRINALKQRERAQMSLHPFGQVLHVRDGVHDAARTQHICILCQKGRRDDARLVLAQLEVRVREEEEERG